MHPILLRFGGWGLRAYGVCTVLGYLAGAAYFRRYRAEYSFTDGDILDASLAIVAGALVGGKLGGLLFYYHGPWPGLRVVSYGGLSFYQGFWGAVLAGWLFFRARGNPVGPFADRAAVVAPLGQAIGRLGCFLNGCCYGKPTRLPWGMNFDAGGRIPPEYLGLRLHPNQLYDLCGNAAIALVLHAWLSKPGRRRLPAGSMFCLYMIAYAVFRFGLEPLRGDDPGSVRWVLTTAQWIAALHVACAAYFLKALNASGRLAPAGPA